MRNAEGRARRDRSAYRPLRVLELFSEQTPVLTASQVARHLRVHRSTGTRILHELARHGFLARETTSGAWRLGVKVMEMANVFLAGLDMRAVAMPYMSRLVEETRETVNLTVLDGEDAVNVDQLTGPESVRYIGRLGRRTPLHCTATGKALLAFSPAVLIDRLTAKPLKGFTPRTITDSDELRRECDTIRQQGFATNHGEWEEGVTAFATPIFDRRGLVAAVSVSGPSYRLDGRREREILNYLLRAAQAITRDLGGVPRSAVPA